MKMNEAVKRADQICDLQIFRFPTLLEADRFKGSSLHADPS